MSRPFDSLSSSFSRRSAPGSRPLADGATPSSAPVTGPIILISIDTLRADHLPVYGYTRSRRPAIDALAADGLVFEHAYSHAPQTLPAHTALLSGRLPFETGVRDNVGFAVEAGERLLPQMLRERGFATGGMVSTSCCERKPASARASTSSTAKCRRLAGQSIGQVQRDGGESEAVAEHWLDRVGTSRVFLFLHLYEPHEPYAPPERSSNTIRTTARSPTATRSSAG